MTLRFLVVEGNTREARASQEAAFGRTPSQSYADTVQSIARDGICDIAFPADEGAKLPDGVGLSSYDGIFLTGSALNAYDSVPAVARQIDLMRTIYGSGTPCFGSCWGLQIGAVAAGGEVRKNARGWEVGFARRIVPTGEGRGHPLLEGRPASFDAPAIHTDVVTIPPADCIVLATNSLAPIQAAEIHHDKSTFWGVQYHPEFSLSELAAILRRRAKALVTAGLCRNEKDAEHYASDLMMLETDSQATDLAWRYGLDEEILDPVLRTREIRNFIEFAVKGEKTKRGRA